MPLGLVATTAHSLKLERINRAPSLCMFLYGPSCALRAPIRQELIRSYDIIVVAEKKSWVLAGDFESATTGGGISYRVATNRHGVSELCYRSPFAVRSHGVNMISPRFQSTPDGAFQS